MNNRLLTKCLSQTPVSFGGLLTAFFCLSLSLPAHPISCSAYLRGKQKTTPHQAIIDLVAQGSVVGQRDPRFLRAGLITPTDSGLCGTVSAINALHGLEVAYSGTIQIFKNHPEVVAQELRDIYMRQHSIDLKEGVELEKLKPTLEEYFKKKSLPYEVEHSSFDIEDFDFNTFQTRQNGLFLVSISTTLTGPQFSFRDREYRHVVLVVGKSIRNDYFLVLDPEKPGELQKVPIELFDITLGPYQIRRQSVRMNLYPFLRQDNPTTGRIIQYLVINKK